MKRVLIGLCGGGIGALMQLLFLMSAPDLAAGVYWSTAFTWISTGILISACGFKLPGPWKGVIVAGLVSAPTLVYTVLSSASAFPLRIEKGFKSPVDKSKKCDRIQLTIK